MRIIKGILLYPERYFADVKNQEGSLKIPSLVIGLQSLFSSALQYFLMIKVSQILPNPIIHFYLVSGYIMMAVSFLSPFLNWLIFSLIMYGLSVFFGGKGSFRRTFEFIGYGFMPLTIGTIISDSVMINHISDIKLPKLTMIDLRNSEIMRSIASKIFPQDLVLSLAGMNTAFLVWSLMIWTYSLKIARNLRLRDSLVCSLIPTLLLWFIQIYTMSSISPHI